MHFSSFKTAAHTALISTSIAVFISALIASPAAAQDLSKKSSPFVGLAQSSLKIKLNDLPDASWKANAVGVNAGIPITDHLWLEAKALKGTSNSTNNILQIELDHYLGASLVGRWPIISTGFSLYGSVGAGKIKLTGSIPGVQVSESDSSLSYGFGVMYTTGPLNLRVGYENLYSDDDLEIDGLNVAGTYQF